MKISYSWLKQYVDINVSPDELSIILTDLGLEVEGTENFETVKGGLKDLVVGKVLSCEKHPNADRLSCTTVDIGKKEPLRIVCGAPNVAAGQKVVVAPVGTELTMGDKHFTIEKTKLRGELSEGMICAEDEIGLGDSHEGILVLDDKMVTGTPVKDYFHVETDVVYEIGLTPNRVDAASHYGVARDVAAFMNQTKPCKAGIPGIGDFSVDNNKLPYGVHILNEGSCKRYAGITISGVTVEASPQWLQTRLRSIGLNPINNVVDITNFVLHELGQPLHAFDVDRLVGNKIIVKNVTKGTKFKTLDEQEHTLTEEDLLICDEKKPVALAGIFGGLNSGVSDDTKNIFLESAYFNPVSTRKTSKRLGISTDSSFRFERGVDPDMTVYALKRAANLIREIAGGEISSDIIDVYPEKIMPFEVSVSYEHVDRLIGEKIEPEKIKKILGSLDIEIRKESAGGLELLVPPYRVDVTRGADVIEEILRIYGYNNIGISGHYTSSVSYSPKPDNDKLTNVIADYLSSNGFMEIMSNSLTRSDYYKDCKTYKAENLVKIMNPLSSDLNCMRQTLLFGGLEAIIHNINRKNHDLRLYEFGNCYFYDRNAKGKDLLTGYSEYMHLALFITGLKHTPNWTSKEEESSLFQCKAYVENILKKLGYDMETVAIEEIGNDADLYAYGLEMKTRNETLAVVAAIKKEILDLFDIGNEVFYAGLRWESIVKRTADHKISYKEVPKFPEVKRDMALLIDNSVTYRQLAELVSKENIKQVRKVGLFDVYQGKGIPEGKKSYALSFIIRDEEKTLTDDEIDAIMKRLAKVFTGRIGAEIR